MSENTAFIFWIVYRGDGRAPSSQHDTRKEAQIETERLAAINPDTRFYVLEVVAACQSPAHPVQWLTVVNDDSLV